MELSVEAAQAGDKVGKKAPLTISGGPFYIPRTLKARFVF